MDTDLAYEVRCLWLDVPAKPEAVPAVRNNDDLGIGPATGLEEPEPLCQCHDSAVVVPYAATSHHRDSSNAMRSNRCWSFRRVCINRER